MTGLTFSPDGDMLAGVSHDVLWCWTRSRNWEPTGIRHPDGFAGVAFHPGGRTLAYITGHDLRQRPRVGVHLHSLTATREFDTDVLLFREDGDEGDDRWYRDARGLAFTPDGRTLLSRTDDEDGGFFSGLFDRPRRAVIIHWHFTLTGDRWNAALVPGRTPTERGAALVGTTCLALAARDSVHVCPLDPAATAPILAPDVSRLDPVASSMTGELVAGTDGQRIYVWHLREAKPVAAWRVPPTVLALALSPDARTLATGGQDGAVTLYDPLTGGRGSSFNFGVGAVQSLAYAPDGLTLAIAGDRGLVVVDVG